MLRATHRLNVPATLLLGIVLWPGRAHADDEAAGRVLFNDAMAQVKRGQLNEACPKFEESLRQSYNINAHYFLADCWERQGRTATAWTTFLRVATNARDANDEGREAAARKRAESLEPKLVRLRILVTRDVDGLEVRRNGNLVGRPMWTEVVPVDPGDVEFTATAPGFEPFKTTVSLSGEGKTVDVRIPSSFRKPPSSSPQRHPRPRLRWPFRRLFSHPRRPERAVPTDPEAPGEPSVGWAAEWAWPRSQRAAWWHSWRRASSIARGIPTTPARTPFAEIRIYKKRRKRFQMRMLRPACSSVEARLWLWAWCSC